MSKLKNNPIKDYKTFQYVKAELEQDLVSHEEMMKQQLASKIPFGLGDTLLNKAKEGKDVKKELAKTAINSSLPVVKKVLFKLIQNNKKKLLIWGVSGVSAMVLGVFLNKKVGS